MKTKYIGRLGTAILEAEIEHPPGVTVGGSVVQDPAGRQYTLYRKTWWRLLWWNVSIWFRNQWKIKAVTETLSVSGHLGYDGRDEVEGRTPSTTERPRTIIEVLERWQR